MFFSGNSTKAIVTTSWDDGHVLDMRLATLLHQYAIPATLYIAPQNREQASSNLLTNAQVVELSREFEIGAHTMTHPLLPSISLNEAKHEIRTSKQYLEDLLGKPVPMFCYPRGLYNHAVANAVRDAGFLGARTIQPFITSYPNDPFTMGTTHHHVNRTPFHSFKLALGNNWHFLPFIFTSDWVTFAKRSFDHVRKHGGIWHLWGHSWQIDQLHQWGELEQVLTYISQHDDVQYATNGSILSAG